MASMKDVARLAGVGVATVSRVLNESGYVSEDTRRKIMNAIEELDYKPNELARQLFRKKAGMIAVLMPDVSHPFFAELVKDVEALLYENGYKTMLCNTFKEKNSEQEYLDMLDRHIVDGIITGVHSLEIQSYLKIKKPIVAFDRNLGEDIPVVRVDHEKGGRMAAEMLIQSGCKKVLQFQGAKAVNSPSDARHTAFQGVMDANGIPVISIELGWNKFEASYFEKITEQVLEEYPDVDGVFGTDLLVLYYMKAALKKNRKVPEELKIVAYDGTYVVDSVTPSITSIVQPIPVIAQKLVGTICDMVDGKKVRQPKMILDVSVHQGGTTELYKRVDTLEGA